jgi:hypothetical protein
MITFRNRRVRMAFQLGAAKIIALEEQRRLGDGCDGIGKAVAHIEARGVASFSIVLEGMLGRVIVLLNGTAVTFGAAAKPETIWLALANPLADSTIRASNSVGQPISSASGRRTALKASASGSSSAIARMTECRRRSSGQAVLVIEIVMGGGRSDRHVPSSLGGQVPDRIKRMAVLLAPQLAVIVLKRLLDELVHRQTGAAGERMRQPLGLGAADASLWHGHFWPSRSQISLQTWRLELWKARNPRQMARYQNCNTIAAKRKTGPSWKR